MEDRKNIGGVVEIEWFYKKAEEYMKRWISFNYPYSEQIYFEGVKLIHNCICSDSHIRLEFSGSFFYEKEQEEEYERANWHSLDLQDFLRITQDLDYHFEKLEESKAKEAKPQNRYNLIDEDFKKEEKKEKV